MKSTLITFYLKDYQTYQITNTKRSDPVSDPERLFLIRVSDPTDQGSIQIRNTAVNWRRA